MQQCQAICRVAARPPCSTNRKTKTKQVAREEAPACRYNREKEAGKKGLRHSSIEAFVCLLYA